MYQSGFQYNTTIHAAFWAFIPDPALDPVARTQIVEVNSLQYIEANPVKILAPTVTQIQIVGGLLTVIAANTFQNGNHAGLYGFTTATYLNETIVKILQATPTQFTARVTFADTPLAADTGVALDAGSRSVWLYYAASNVSTAQAPYELKGIVAQSFLFDMGDLFT